MTGIPSFRTIWIDAKNCFGKVLAMHTNDSMGSLFEQAKGELCQQGQILQSTTVAVEEAQSLQCPNIVEGTIESRNELVVPCPLGQSQMFAKPVVWRF